MSRSHPRLNYTRHTLFEYAFMYNTAGDIAVVVYIDLFYPLAMGKQLKETRHKMYKPYTPLYCKANKSLLCPILYFFVLFSHTHGDDVITHEWNCLWGRRWIFPKSSIVYREKERRGCRYTHSSVTVLNNRSRETGDRWDYSDPE